MLSIALFVWVFRPRKVAPLPHYQLLGESSAVLAKGATLEFSVRPSASLEGAANVRFFVVQDGRADPVKPVTEGSLASELFVRAKREDAFGNKSGKARLVSVVARPDVDRDLESIAKREISDGPGWQRMSVEVTLPDP